jgi:hypothetical protein
MRCIKVGPKTAGRRNFSSSNGPKGSVVNATDFYPKDVGFDSRVMLEFSPHVKEVEDIGLTPRKRSKKSLVILTGKALTYYRFSCQFCLLVFKWEAVG